MTDLQKEFYDKNKELDKIVADFNSKHKLLKKIKKNVIYPLIMEVDKLAMQVHGARKTNYKFESD